MLSTTSLKKQIPSSKQFIRIGLVVVATAIVVGGLAYWLSGKGPGGRVQISANGIRKVAQLASVEYSMSTVVEEPFYSKGLFSSSVHSSTMLALYSGRVTGWIDMEKVGINPKKHAVKTAATREVRRFATIHSPRGSIIVNEVGIDPEVDVVTERITHKKTGAMLGVCLFTLGENTHGAPDQEGGKRLPAGAPTRQTGTIFISTHDSKKTL